MGRPTIYNTRQGDTFASVSRSVSGSESRADQIKNSNPGTTEPFNAGTILSIPESGANQRKKYRADGLDIKIGGRQLDSIDSFSIQKASDGFRQCKISTANEIQTRDIFPQMQSTTVDIGYNGNAELTGHTAAPRQSASGNRKGLNVNVFSDAHWINSPPPTPAFPMEWKNADLEKIANRVCGLYSVDTFFDVDPGARFTKVKIKPGENSFSFLTGLTKQRAMVMTDDEFGSVVFSDGAGTGAPVLVIDDEARPDVKVEAVTSMNNYYSFVTGVLKSKRGKSKKSFTVNNPHYVGVIKPGEFEISDSDEGELETAVNTYMGRMFANAFKVNITIPGWTDRNGEILKAGGLVKVRSPKDYIEDFIELDIHSVALNKRPSMETATVSCVLPGVFAGKIPEVVPWR